MFDDADGHLISGDDSSSGGVHFHLTRDLEAGTYTVLITSTRATRYLLTENARLRTRDGVNSGGGCYLNGDATLDGMKTFLNADDDFSGVAYSLNITTPMPEPASYALVARAGVRACGRAGYRPPSRSCRRPIRSGPR
ncbi:MAG: hypothetical protein H7242_21230 [Microbacteriaceae bacterium]|nr:hypothetical protein [Burkholderiaceae bacterium]